MVTWFSPRFRAARPVVGRVPGAAGAVAARADDDAPDAAHHPPPAHPAAPAPAHAQHHPRPAPAAAPGSPPSLLYTEKYVPFLCSVSCACQSQKGQSSMFVIDLID